MNLKQLLDTHGIKQRRLAEAIGLSTATVNNIVNKGIYPKTIARADIDQRITHFL